MPKDVMSGNGSLRGSYMAVFSVFHIVSKSREKDALSGLLEGINLSWGLHLLNSQKPLFLIPSH